MCNVGIMMMSCNAMMIQLVFGLLCKMLLGYCDVSVDLLLLCCFVYMYMYASDHTRLAFPVI